MMETTFLSELRAKGIRLGVQGNQLTVDAPKGMLTDTLRQATRQYKAAFLAVLTPRPPRHTGGFPVMLPETPCPLCGGMEGQQHVTYRYCRTCGREDGPGAIVDADTPMSNVSYSQ
jgi:hypothetical protein